MNNEEVDPLIAAALVLAKRRVCAGALQEGLDPMKAVLLALVFLQFTGPNGNPIWVASSQVSYVTPAAYGLCWSPAITVISTLSGNVCVRETTDEVIKQLGSGK